MCSDDETRSGMTDRSGPRGSTNMRIIDIQRDPVSLSDFVVIADDEGETQLRVPEDVKHRYLESLGLYRRRTTTLLTIRVVVDRALHYIRRCEVVDADGAVVGRLSMVSYELAQSPADRGQGTVVVPAKNFQIQYEEGEQER